jgi:hypothetical protein
MLAGTVGKPGATDLHFCAVATPQILVAVTQMLPAALNVGPKFTVMLLVVDVPVAPDGKVHA